MCTSAQPFSYGWVLRYDVMVGESDESIFSLVRGDLIFASALSLGCSLLLLVLYRSLPRVQRTPGWLMLRATVCEVVVSACFLAVWLYERDDQRWMHDVNHLFSGVLLTLCGFETAAHAWRLVVYLEVVAVYRNPFEPDKFRSGYTLFVVATAAITAFVIHQVCLPAFIDPVNGTAVPNGPTAVDAAPPPAPPSLPSDPEREAATVLVLELAFVYVPFGLFASLGFVLNTAVRLLVESASSSDGAPPSISFLARQRVMRHGWAYLVLYGVQLSAAVALDLVITYTPDSESLWHVLALLVVGRPAISFVGWAVINDVLYLSCGVCSFTKCCRPQAASVRGRFAGILGSNSNLDPPPSVFGSFTETRSARAPDRQGIEEVGFKEELRFELLYDVAVGIGELAQQELYEEQQAAQQQALSGSEPWRASVDIGAMAHTGAFVSPSSGATQRAGGRSHAPPPRAREAAAAQSVGGHPRPRAAANLQQPLLSPPHGASVLATPDRLRSEGGQPCSPGLAPLSIATSVDASATPPPLMLDALGGAPSHGIPRSASESHLAALQSAVRHAASPRSQAQHYEVARFRRLRSMFGDRRRVRARFPGRPLHARPHVAAAAQGGLSRARAALLLPRLEAGGGRRCRR